MVTHPGIKLRKATLDDCGLLEYWDTQPHVLAASDEEEDWANELPREVSWREYLIAELAGKPIGFVQIIDPLAEETHYWGKVGANKRAIDIWIGEKDFLNKGHGTSMMNLAIERCFEPPAVDEILIDPLATNTAAIRFYKRLGFEFVEHRIFGEDACEVYSLTRERWFGK